MKNNAIKLFPVYLAGVLVMVCSAWLLTPLVGNVHWLFVILAAVALCLCAVACHAVSKRRTKLYLWGYLLNAISSGTAIAALYSQKLWEVNINILLMAVVPAAVLGLALCMGYLINNRSWRKIWGLVMLLLTLGLIVASIVVCLKWHRGLGSMGLFSGISLLFFMMACLAATHEPEDQWRYLSFSGFWAFATIAIVVALILSDGALLDGLDFDLDLDFPSKKKQKH